MITETPIVDLPNDTRFYWENLSFNGEVTRTFIIDTDGFSKSNANKVTTANDYMTMKKGESDAIKNRTIVPTSVDFKLRDPDVDLTPLFSGRDDRFKVVIQDNNYDTIFEGFLLTDFFRRTRFDPQPTVNLTASDGLSFLKDREFTVDSIRELPFANSEYQTEQTKNGWFNPLEFFYNILPHDIDFQTSLEWQRTNIDNQFESDESDFLTENVLNKVAVPFEPFLEKTHFEALSLLLRTFNLRLEQTFYNGSDYAQIQSGRSCVWNMSNRWQLAEESNRVFRYKRLATRFFLKVGFPTQGYFTKSQENIQFESNVESVFERRSGKTISEFNFDGIEQLIKNPSFETGDTTNWEIPTATPVTIQVLENPNQTQNDEYYLDARFNSTTGESNIFLYQDIDSLATDIIDFDISFEAEFTRNPLNVALIMELSPNFGDYYLHLTTAGINGTYLEGEEFEMELNTPLEGPIAEGTELIIYEDVGSTAGPTKIGSVEVTSRATTGQEFVEVTTTQSFTGSDMDLCYWYFDDTEQVKPGDDRNLDGAFWVGPAAGVSDTSGSRVDYNFRFTNELPDGSTFNEGFLRFSANRQDSATGPGGQVNTINVDIDNIELTLTDPIDVEAFATTNELEGDIDRFKIASDISLTPNRRFNLVGVERDSFDAYGRILEGFRYRNTGSLKKLGEIVTEKQTETFLEHNEKVSITVQRKAGTNDGIVAENYIYGHEPILFNNELWEITKVNTNYYQGTQQLELIQLNNEYTNTVDYNKTRVIGQSEQIDLFEITDYNHT